MMHKPDWLEAALSAPIDAGFFATAEGGVDAAILADPQGYLESLRQQEGDFIPAPEGVLGGKPVPFLQSPVPGRPTFVATGYETLKSVLVDDRHFLQDYEFSLAPIMGETLISGLNPPVHAKYRALVSKAFGAKSISALTDESLEPLVTALLERIAAQGGGELVADLACRIPVVILGQLIGLPPTGYDRFAELAARIMAFAYHWDDAMAAAAELRELVLGLIEARRADPQGDLLSHLLAAEIDGERLSDEDVVTFARALIPAGIETTTRGMGTVFAALLSQPGLYQRLLADASLVPVAVEEILRWNGPAQMIPKKTSIDVEIAGRVVPANASIWCALGHANRDPQFWDRPTEIALDRPRGRSLTFSNGAHTCIGNVLARKELEGTVQLALRILPKLRLDPQAQAPQIQGVLFRSPDRCAVLV
ncbi:MAG: cytochrome P450 [Sphingomonadaceae bacterium]|nr:cytochrome P450 [Sphingomonadaceae bacterium]